MNTRRLFSAILLTVALAVSAAAQIDESTFKNLTWRNVGPAGASGRISDIAATGPFPQRIYAATASGGIFKTSNNGVTWEPIFDNQATVSVGDIAVDPHNPDVLWVGTGESNPRNSVSWGDGVYKTTDAGKTWTNLGLRDTRHIGRVVIDPRNTEVVYVAAVGHTWGPNRDRGLYKTSDGGRTWNQVLFVDENTGFIDLAMDPQDSNTLYAASWQRRRDHFAGGDPAICCGKGSGIYKSSDAGRTWRKLTSGLPDGDLGRIGIDVSVSNPSTLYAIIQTPTTVPREGAGVPGMTPPPPAPKTAKDGGIFRSDDRGETWRWVNPLNIRPFYYSQLRIDPTDENKVWALSSALSMSEDGGRNFQNLPINVHVDHHALWIDPRNPKHMVLGNDGGIYATYDGGKAWDFMNQIAISQFYAVDVDMRKPYFIYGGTQDYCSWGGPSATRNSVGITNADWFKVQTGDGFQVRIDPTDHNIVYAESQNGGLVRHDLRSGRNVNIKPRPESGEDPYRFNWETPILISPHDPKTLYVGGNFLFRSNDRGNSWTKVSGDLTDGPGAERLSSITTVAESPLRAGILYAGTDEGNVHVTRDGGRTWKNITKNFPGMPAKRWVSRLIASRWNEGTAYAALDGHRHNDYATYLYRTTDYGDTWTAIRSNLPPEGPVRVVREDYKNRNLLFVGTEFGAYASLDSGARWMRFMNGMPTVAVADLVVHPRDGDLVAGTHGRSFYVAEITPLQQMTDAVMSADVHLFTPRPAMAFMYKVFSDDEFLADKRFFANNPEFGSSIFYHLKSAAPEDAKLTILDRAGAVVRELTGSKEKGIQRIQWDLRYPAPPRLEGQGGGGPGARNLGGPMVDPGEYTARLVVAGKTLTTTVVVEADPQVQITEAERRSLRTITNDLLKTMGTVVTSVRSADAVQEQVAAMSRQITDHKTSSEALRKNAADLAKQAEDLRTKIRQLNTRITAVYGEVSGSPHPATATQQNELLGITKELDSQITALNGAIAGLPSLEVQMNRENVPRGKAIEPVRK